MGIEFLFLIDFIILFFQPHRWNFFATLAVGYLGIFYSGNNGSPFMDMVFECSKRIYKIPKFVFYATGYAFKQIFSKTSSGIMNYFRKHALPCHQFPANHIKNGA